MKKNWLYAEKFTPQFYYESWCDAHGISLKTVPYSLVAHDPRVGRRVPFAVISFDHHHVHEQPVAMVTVWYCSTHSDSAFAVDLLL